MRILILYGTSEGQTRKIAQRLAERLVALGQVVSPIDVDHCPPALAADDFDATIIAARVHAGRYPRRILSFISANQLALKRRPSAFLSVSMSAALHVPGDKKRLDRYVSDFIGRTGWTPARIYHVAGARLYTRHNVVGRWLLGIVDRHRYDTNQDHEFTDWPAVDRLAEAFLGSIAPAPAEGRLPAVGRPYNDQAEASAYGAPGKK
jgi:menaquinone-dependent protoporphyrinogen oxidase